MKYNIRVRGFLSTSLTLLITLLAINSFAGEKDKMAWSVIQPEDSNFSIQQERVMTSFETTLIELNSVINKQIRDGKISNDSDFTVNKEVTLVYDYLMFRIYELSKVDRKIRKDLESDSSGKYQAMKIDYDHRGASFFSSLDSLKRAVLIKDIQAEVNNLKSYLGELRSAMNLYSNYSVAVAARQVY